MAATLVLAGLGAAAHLRLPLDVGNRSMKATGTSDAAAAERRATEFGEEQVVIALVEPRGSAVSGEPADPEVARWLAALRAEAGVLSVDVLPQSDARGTLAAIALDHGDEPGASDASGRTLAESIDHLRRLTPATHRLSLTGQPVGEVAIARALAAEQRRVVPAILAVLTLALLAVLRRPSLAAAALLPGIGAVGLIGLVEHAAGRAIDPLSALLAPVLLTIGVAGAVHVVARHLDHLREGVAPLASPGLAVRALARPVVLTTLTTVAGFLALLPNAIPAVRSFGAIAAFGVVLSALLTLVVVPAWLRLWVVVDRHGARVPPPDAARADRVATALARRARWIVGVCGVAFAALVALGLGVATDTHPERVLPADHPFRTATARVAERLGGIDTVELLLPAEPGAEPPSLLAAAALGGELGRHELLANLPGLPRRAPSGSLLVTALVHPSGSAEREAAFAWIEERAAARGFSAALVTGPAVRVARDSERLVRSQVASLALMLLVVAGALAAGFRSWRLALIGIVPNVVPIAALHGGLALLDRPLSASTALIGSVFLGLVVDDTIHFLHGYERARRAGADARSAVAASFRACGRALVVTSLVLGLGFGAASIGNLSTTVEFAVVSAAVIAIALLADVVLLPALLVVVHGERTPSTGRTRALAREAVA